MTIKLLQRLCLTFLPSSSKVTTLSVRILPLSQYPFKYTCGCSPLPHVFATQMVYTLFYTLVFFHLIFLGDGIILYTQHFLIHLNSVA